MALVPIGLHETVWVSEHAVSRRYLEVMACFYSWARLGVTPETVDQQHRIILKWTLPSTYALTPLSKLDMH